MVVCYVTLQPSISQPPGKTVYALLLALDGKWDEVSVSKASVCDGYGVFPRGKAAGWDQLPVRGVTSEDGGPVYQRRLCGVQIRGVRAVRQSGMPSDRKSALFNLLAIRADDAGTTDGERIELLFSDGAALQFDLDGLSVIAEDIEAGQPTPNRPAHDVET